jgi:tRNA (adenine57-N1/adenine58-N1)-methyltransferase
VGQPFGHTVSSQIGHAALLLEPSVGDLMRHLKRGTQVIYPKDAAYLVHRLNLHAGSTIIEAGTGSGALTIALAWSVAPTGRVYTYEIRTDNYNVAHQNLARFGLLPHVEMFNTSIEAGFRQQGVDALFLDVREPWRYLDHVHAALRTGGFFASLLPTANQVSQLLATLEESAFASVEVEELLLRRYKPVPDRLRPEDSMIGHTGYLVFARTISAELDPSRWLSRDRKRYRARQIAREQIEEEEARRAQERARGGPKYPRLPLPD